MMQMLKQGINIFDQKHPFYIDICHQYDSPEKKIFHWKTEYYFIP